MTDATFLDAPAGTQDEFVRVTYGRAGATPDEQDRDHSPRSNPSLERRLGIIVAAGVEENAFTAVDGRDWAVRPVNE